MARSQYVAIVFVIRFDRFRPKSRAPRSLPRFHFSQVSHLIESVANALITHQLYAARLDTAPNNILALMGASFARWVYFDYLGAMHLLDHLLDLEPANPYGNLFRAFLASPTLRLATSQQRLPTSRRTSSS